MFYLMHNNNKVEEQIFVQDVKEVKEKKNIYI